MRAWKLGLLGLLLIVGCSDPDPVGPGLPPDTPPTSISIVREAAELGRMLDDLQERVLPSLPEDSRRTDLSASLQHLRMTFARGQVVDVARALDEARTSADRFALAHEDEATAVEFDNLRSALDVVAEYLDGVRR